jgi:hypothetical protein
MEQSRISQRSTKNPIETLKRYRMINCEDGLSCLFGGFWIKSTHFCSGTLFEIRREQYIRWLISCWKRLEHDGRVSKGSNLLTDGDLGGNEIWRLVRLQTRFTGRCFNGSISTWRKFSLLAAAALLAFNTELRTACARMAPCRPLSLRPLGCVKVMN